MKEYKTQIGPLFVNTAMPYKNRQGFWQIQVDALCAKREATPPDRLGPHLNELIARMSFAMVWTLNLQGITKETHHINLTISKQESQVLVPASCECVSWFMFAETTPLEDFLWKQP